MKMSSPEIFSFSRHERNPYREPEAEHDLHRPCASQERHRVQ